MLYNILLVKEAVIQWHFNYWANKVTIIQGVTCCLL